MGKIKLGIMGGGRGADFLNSTPLFPDVELVAVCDFYKPILERMQFLAENRGMNQIKYYMDFEEFIQHDMDAVILANYAHRHAPYAIRLLDSGRHVMSEVLACSNMKEAVELIEAVERSGKVYSYAENYCYTPVRQEMYERYQRGDIGELMYAECEYVHDCFSDPLNQWWMLTYGERDHWRNQMSSTFYCTHSLGPILHITGLRPVKVSGFQTQNMPYAWNEGSGAGCGGIEMVTLENGAIVKSLHGSLKKHENVYYLVGDKGNLTENNGISVYIENEPRAYGTTETYMPEPKNVDAANAGHGGGDYYTLAYFFGAIRGDQEAIKNTLDVYAAVDMTIIGILAYRSICNGNVSIDIPNLRNPEEREAYRNDTFCTFPEIAGDMWVSNSLTADPIPDSVYDVVRGRWEEYLKNKHDEFLNN